MRKIPALLLICLLLISLVSPAVATSPIVTTATGYTSAKDVEYITVSGTLVNWGARGEECVFLTTYAQDYYTDSYSWETLSALDGGSSISNAYTSDLYDALQDMMQARHTKQTSYGETRYLYRYTDCTANDYQHISSFYSGTTLNGAWDSGATWNREHTWPCSKTDLDRPNNSTISESTDIMTLRPTAVSENGDRGNKAYGESSGYFDPGESVRGDCARTMLYVYVRWGNTNYMWGSSGVIESLDLLLRWMEEDPVDTWEMARNDSVQSITGVRNVFVDYPEYAWLLFGENVPEDLETPSNSESTPTDPSDPTEPTECPHTQTQRWGAKNPTCGKEGYTGDLYCNQCMKLIEAGTAIPATGEHTYGKWTTVQEPGELTPGLKRRTCSVCSYVDEQEIPALGCSHSATEIKNEKAPTCGETGYTGDTYCKHCGKLLETGRTLTATGDHTFGEWVTTKEPGEFTSGQQQRKCSGCDKTESKEIPALGCQHGTTKLKNQKDATCAEPGYTGDTYCAVCDALLETGSAIAATGNHSFGEWVTTKEPGEFTSGQQQRKCTGCDKTETKDIPAIGCQHGTTELKNQKDATCAEPGYTGDTYCAVCDALLETGSAIAATGNHSFGEWVTTKEPGEFTAGQQQRKCAVCRKTETKDIPALGCQHGTTELKNQKDATCAEPGYTGDTYCTQCGGMLSAGAEIPAAGHTDADRDWSCDVCGKVLCDHAYTEIRNETPATCAEDGYTGDTHCTVCGKQLRSGEAIPATGEHSFGDWITAPGGGSEGRWCSVCGLQEQRELPPCQHEHTQLDGVKAPTCTEDGHTGRLLCTDCGSFADVGEVIPATGHADTNGDRLCDNCALNLCAHEHSTTKDEAYPGCDKEGYTGDIYCADCGKLTASGSVIPATGHQRTELRGEKAATCGEDGYTGDTHCADCGELLTPGEPIAATGEHSFGEWVTNEDLSSRDCTVCGHRETDYFCPGPGPAEKDHTVIIVVAAAIVIAGSIIAFVIIKKRKTK